MESLTTLFQILPFVAIILLEASPRRLSTKFNTIYKRTFDSTDYHIIDEDLDEVLFEELEGTDLSEAEITEMAAMIQSEVGVDEEVLSEFLGDYITFANDWMQTKVSLFTTFVSAQVVLSINIFTQMQPPSTALLILIVAIPSLIFIIYAILDELFERSSPHSYVSKTFYGITPASIVVIVANILIIFSLLLF